MAITGNPGDLATGGFGTGVRGVAATPRDVANAVARGQAMAASRNVGQGGNRDIGGGFRGPIGTWGSPGSIVPGSMLARIAASPLAPYGGAFNVTQEELVDAALANAGLMSGGPMNPSLFELQKMAQQVQESPELQGVLGAVYGPFASGVAPSVPAGILGEEVAAALPSVEAPSTTVPSIETAVETPSDMGPTSDAAISAALSYQNTPLENDIAFLASRVGPSASPEALALVDPTFVQELAREIRQAETATGATARINDLYRSPETQGQIFTELKARNPNYMVAPAGSSWHQAAVAADVARGPVLNYMRANTPSTLNFPFGQNDLVHVQMSNPTMAQTGVNRGFRGAFRQTVVPDNSIFGLANVSDSAPVAVAEAPVFAPKDQVAMALPPGSLAPAYTSRGQDATPVSPSPAPVVAEAPAARAPSLPPRTPTPNTLARLYSQFTGQPLYQTASLLEGQPNTSRFGNERQQLASSLLASAQPTAPARERDREKEKEPEVEKKPVPVQPVQLSSSLLPDWYWEWYKSRGLTGGLLG